MGEKVPEQKGPSPEEQRKRERLQQQIEAKTKEFQGMYQKYAQLGQKFQELQKRAQEGDEKAAAELQELQKQIIAMTRKMVETLSQIRSFYEELGVVDKFDGSQLGQIYEQLQARLEA